MEPTPVQTVELILPCKDCGGDRAVLTWPQDTEVYQVVICEDCDLV